MSKDGNVTLETAQVGSDSRMVEVDRWLDNLCFDAEGAGARPDQMWFLFFLRLQQYGIQMVAEFLKLKTECEFLKRENGRLREEIQRLRKEGK